jgi:hypothetical protein
MHRHFINKGFKKILRTVIVLNVTQYRRIICKIRGVRRLHIIYRILKYTRLCCGLFHLFLFIYSFIRLDVLFFVYFLFPSSSFCLTHVYSHIKGKKTYSSPTPMCHAMKTNTGRVFRAPLILYLGSRRKWVVTFTFRPLYAYEMNPIYAASANLNVVANNIHDVAMTFPEWFYSPTWKGAMRLDHNKDMSMSISTCTSYNFNTLTPVVWKLWWW